MGVSRARVTHVLRVLKLNPEAPKPLVVLGDPLALPILTERRIQPIVSLPVEEQKRSIDTILQDTRNRQP